MSGMDRIEAVGFMYPALDDAESQIRLLQSLPNEAEELRFTLEVFERETAPEFKAISYTCGDVNNPATLYFDNDTPAPQPIYVGDQIFRTADNCSYVLRQAWPYYCGGYVWIDQICINQKNNHEKGVQVRSMDKIYTKATSALACLGSHADDSELVMEAALDAPRIGRSDDDIEEYYDYANSNMWNEYELKQAGWALDYGKVRFYRLRDAFEAFGGRRYWSRLWIVRELACAHDAWILCGKDAAPWIGLQILDGIFKTSTSSENIKSKWTSNPRYQAGLFEEVVEHAFTPSSGIESYRVPPIIDDALDMFREFRCKDARDRIYAILPFVSESDRNAIIVDYSESSFNLATRVIARIELLAVPALVLTLEIDSTDNDVQEERESELGMYPRCLPKHQQIRPARIRSSLRI